MESDLPRTLDELHRWALETGVSPATARVRFAQHSILMSVGANPTLRRKVVFKGGNALDFVWSPNRSTVDLDFSVVDTTDGPTVAHAQMRELFSRSLEDGRRHVGVIAKVQRWDVFPRDVENARFSAVQATVGYALPDEVSLVNRMLRTGLDSTHVIPLDISFNDQICAFDMREIGPRSSIAIATREDIVAEKLRALLQQRIRNRSRPQDVLDLAVIISTSELDRAQVAQFLQVKSAARDVSVSRDAFRDDDLRLQASVGYDHLAALTRKTFIPFDDAIAIVLAFVADLAIPD